MSERPLTIVSLNIRGLGKDSAKQKLIKTWLTSLQNAPQILLIQEHHLDKQGVDNSTKGLEFWQGKAFWNPGIPMGTSQRTRAGTAILVDRATAPLIKVDRILVEGRVQHIISSPTRQFRTSHNQHLRPKDIQRQSPHMEENQ
jgi:hypothetical protein